MKKDKIYQAVMTLGATSTTDDREGEIVTSWELGVEGAEKLPSQLAVTNAINSFIGTQQQVPPQFSAIKVDGKRAYAQARKGQAVELKPRTITVHSISDIVYAWPTIGCTLTVSSGTYIRSIARDIGHTLGCGAYLSDLRRTAIDTFSVRQAVSTDKLSTRPLHDLLLPLDK